MLRSKPQLDRQFQSIQNFSALSFLNATKKDLLRRKLKYIKDSPFEIEINREDFDLFKLAESDGMKYLQQGLALNKALSRWNTSMSVSNNDKMEIFTTLALVCEQFGMDKNDEETMGLLFIVSIFYTTILKDSQKDRVNCERWWSLGSFFATEFPNRWLIEKSKS
jgi:hypothetical protein